MKFITVNAGSPAVQIRVNIEHISSYSKKDKGTLIATTSARFEVKETPEEVDKLIHAVTNEIEHLELEPGSKGVG